MKYIFIFIVVFTSIKSLMLPTILLGKEDSKILLKFQNFMDKYNKSSVYESAGNMIDRFQIFKENLEIQKKLNEESDGAIFGVNKFSDLTEEEFKSKYLGYKRNSEQRNEIQIKEVELDYERMPNAYDWRLHGAVTQVKDQGDCGSCWAFSSIVCLEAQYFLDGNPLTEFSEEEIVDCVPDDGCGGGDQTDAFKYLKYNGIMSEEDYPYTLKTRRKKCKLNSTSTTYGEVNKYAQIPSDEQQIALQLYLNGPIAISINAKFFDHYTSGILRKSANQCPNTDDDLDHAVTLVGYGYEDGVDYWIVKNSYGPDWGEDGYIRMERGTNCCGIAVEPLLVELKRYES